MLIAVVVMIVSFIVVIMMVVVSIGFSVCRLIVTTMLMVIVSISCLLYTSPSPRD